MITAFYAGLLGLIFLRISFETIKARRTLGVSLGAGENGELSYLVAAHSNFAAYTPFFLMTLFFAETIGNYHPVLIHGLGLAFITGRIVHYLTMKDRETTFKKRKLGMILTLTPLIFLSLLCLGVPVKNYFFQS